MKWVCITAIMISLGWLGAMAAIESKPDSSSAANQAGELNFINDSFVLITPERRLCQDIIKAYLKNPAYIDLKFVQVRIIAEGVMIEFFNDPNRPMFTEGKAELTGYGKLLTSVTASTLAKHDKASTKKIEVQGHVSQKFKPGEKDADALFVSTARALNTYRQFIRHGLTKTQFQKVSGAVNSIPLKDHSTPGRVRVIIKLESKKSQ